MTTPRTEHHVGCLAPSPVIVQLPSAVHVATRALPVGLLCREQESPLSCHLPQNQILRFRGTKQEDPLTAGKGFSRFGSVSG